jgi:hypothetical protein
MKSHSNRNFSILWANVEQLREHQRTITRAIRELDRERMRLEQSEKKLIMDIKKNAKQGQMVCHLFYFDLFYLFHSDTPHADVSGTRKSDI